MKIGVISDTHGSMLAMDKAAPYFSDCEFIIHAGDHFSDGRYLFQKTGKNVLAVKGNCDWDDVEDELFFEACGKNFFVCHGHRYDVKYGIDLLEKRASELGADIVVFGHSHVAFKTERNGVLYINPGSPSRPRGNSRRGFMILEFGKTVKIKEIEI